MQRRSLLLGLGLATTLAAAGCMEQVAAPVAAPASASAFRASAAPQSALQSLPGRGLGAITLPRYAAVDAGFNVGNRAIDPGNYVCVSGSPLTDWLNAEIDNTITKEASLFFAMYNRFADYVPVYEALYFQTSATPQYFGYTGAFTKTMVKTEKDVKRFWDIPSAQIQVIAMHGTVLTDVARTTATYNLLGFPPAVSLDWAQVDRAATLASTTMHGGNFALWTFNAVSFRTPDNSVPPKIVMGDGILEGYAAIGYSDVAPQAIFAHEFAHQIQFERGYFNDLPPTASPAEQTRYTELMADAMSAYYLTHSRGANIHKTRVAKFLDVFYQIGDCFFDDPGHHGTPNQRMAAAKFGFDVADQAQKQGHILTSAQFHALFVAKYPTLVAPDAP